MRKDQLESIVLPLLPDGTRILKSTHLSELWAGYGHIFRIHLSLPSSDPSSSSDVGDRENTTWIVKTIRPPHTLQQGEYDEGHARKMLSYRIETNFYRFFAPVLSPKMKDNGCYFPQLLASSSSRSQGDHAEPEEQTLILEDLSIHFPILTERRGTLDDLQLKKSLQWLASFHASSWNIERSPLSSSCDSSSSSSLLSLSSALFCPTPSIASQQNWKGKAVWQQGGYHYLSTRLSELSSIDQECDKWGRLGLNSSSKLAWAVDWCLNNPEDRSHLSLIHGDVKAANMAFSSSNRSKPKPSSTSSSSSRKEEDQMQMAMYDFQYVGVGLGVQDLAKFLTTSIPKSYLDQQGGEKRLLKTYHSFLLQNLPKDAEYAWEDLIHDWELALVSWVRFLAGWSGGFWGNVDWLQDRVERLLRDEKWVEGVNERYKASTQSSA